MKLARHREGQAGTQGSDGRHNISTHLFAATVTVLNEIESTVKKMEESQYYTHAHIQSPCHT